MNRLRALIGLAVVTTLVAACSREDAMDSGKDSIIDMNNPLLAEWTGPHGGVPAFDKMDLASLESALDAGMVLNLMEVDAIAESAEAPTFENTILALERSGDALGRTMTYFGIWSANLSSPELREIQQSVAPKLAAFRARVTQNQKLFERVKAVHGGDEVAGLRPDEQRLVQIVYDRFARNGATLEGAEKERFAAIGQRLAQLYTQFSQNVLADEEKYTLYLTEEQMAGMPDSFKTASAAAAERKGQAGTYAIFNTRSSMDPYLTFAEDRAMREQVWRNYYRRGNNDDEQDNKAVIAEILKLRDERVGLLGYDNFAAWRLEDRMAKNPENVSELLEQVWPAAVARVGEEVADMQKVADREGAGVTVEPWDYRFYAEKVRKERYDLNSDEVKQYLQLDKLRDAMFYVAGELFGFKFAPVDSDSVPVFHPDVQVWEVTDIESGGHIGLWYLDPFARAGKRSGAWASTYRSHKKFDGEETVLVSNNSNFIPGAPGEPALISWSDAETYFHEFGHALHSLSSAVTYRTLNGGVRDYVEFQSQLLERWLLTDPVIEGYLIHHETGEPMPAELVAKIKQAATFNEGFATAEYLASALMDMRYHTVDVEDLDVAAFERDQLAELGMPEEIVMRHRSTHFGHIFSGEGYAAGYYGYLWADVLTADAAEAFAEAPDGFYDKGVAASMVEHLFSPGNEVDPADAYRAFRGRDAETSALMRARGFPVQ
ncbi:MAG: M3 family metallopeptidase [Acidobacteriota bacterium]